MTAVDRIEAGPLWVLGRLFMPSRVRAAACVRRGQHRPELIDLGRAKICRNCGAW